MNAQERDQLQQFLTALRQQRVQPKDAVADALIREALAQQPDAAYALVQRAMALTLALDASQARLAQLQAQCDALSARCPPTTPPSTFGSAFESASDRLSANRTPSDRLAVSAQASPWGRGLLAQVGGTALGVATGVVAGGVVLQGLNAWLGPDATSPALPAGLANGPDSPLTDTGDADDGLWDLGDDWA
jgi:hypothetical protein